MPGYILHLTAAKMYLDRLLIENSSDPLCGDPQQNDFYIGNLLPDSVEGRAAKAVSHFRDPAYRECMMEWPHPDRFIREYRDRMDEAVFRGYLFHLYIDRCFFRDYIPQVAVFYDMNGSETGIRDQISRVFLKKTGESIPPERYLSEEYYYGDYTKMNTWLCRHYAIPEHLDPGKDPGIAEADYAGIDRILEKLKEYGKVREETVRDLKVFELGELLTFLQKAVSEF